MSELRLIKMNEYVNQLIGLDWIESDWYELVRKREKERKKEFFFSLVGGWCLVLDQQQQAISLYTTRIQNNTYSLYIYIYIYSQLLKIRKILTR